MQLTQIIQMFSRPKQTNNKCSTVSLFILIAFLHVNFQWHWSTKDKPRSVPYSEQTCMLTSIFRIQLAILQILFRVFVLVFLAFGWSELYCDAILQSSHNFPRDFHSFCDFVGIQSIRSCVVCIRELAQNALHVLQHLVGFDFLISQRFLSTWHRLFTQTFAAGNSSKGQ